MNVPAAAAHRLLARLNLPLALLLALLQRTPLLRVLAGGGEYVVRSPAGQLLRHALTAAALGALHSRAGATSFVVNRGNPIAGTVGQPLTPAVSFTYTGTPSSPASFQITGGSLPPGVSFIPAPVGGTIRSGTPLITGTPTQAGTFTVSVQGFNAEGLTNSISQDLLFVITGGVTTTAPAIATQPQARTVLAGESVTFSVAASGEPAPAYQWRKNGADIPGATGATLALANVQPADAASYSVVVSNAAGSVTSAAATLTVNQPTTTPPLAITAQPVSQTVASGSTVVFNVGVAGATAYQWRRDGVPLAGATGATLVLENATAAQAGGYSVVASASGAAPVTSALANLSVRDEANFGRIVNLSILTQIPAAGEAGAFTMGYVIGPPGATAPKPLVIRAAGPSLGALGVPGTVADPKIELFAGTAASGNNDNWGGGATLAAALAAVGAFPYTGPASLDAAVAASPAPGSNSVKVTATGSGTVIAEVYDADSAIAPRLINVSVIKPLEAGGKLTAGFVLRGNTARTVLIRAVGPGLAVVGIGAGFAPDPQLALFAGSAKTMENDNWGGDAQVNLAAGRVGAFALPATSKDAVLLATLAPGQYSAEVSAPGGGGLALVEIYEVP